MSLLEKIFRPNAGNGRDDGKVSVLKQLRDCGKPVTVKLEGDPRPYSGVLTAFSEEQLIFVLGKLTPSLPAGKLPVGRMIAILATDRQITTSFTCRCLGQLVPGQDTGYLMKLGSTFNVIEIDNKIDFGARKAGNISDALSAREAA